MKISIYTICLCLIMLSFRAFAQNKQAVQEEYAYYRNGKKVKLTAQPDEVFVTFKSKVSLSKGKTLANGLQHQLINLEEKDVFAPINAVRYKANSGNATSFQTFFNQFESNPDVITAYPAFTIGEDTLYAGNRVTYVLRKGSDEDKVKAFLKNNKSSQVEKLTWAIKQ
jgi:hypothetical protein